MNRLLVRVFVLSLLIAAVPLAVSFSGCAAEKKYPAMKKDSDASAAQLEALKQTDGSGTGLQAMVPLGMRVGADGRLYPAAARAGSRS